MREGDEKYIAAPPSPSRGATPYTAVDYFRMGHAHHTRGDLASSIRCYEKAVELKPDYEEALTNLGFVLKLKGLTDQAIAAYQKALRVNDKNAETYANLGNVFLEQGDTHQATLCYEKAIAMTPSCGAFYFNMATICHKSGQLDNAVKHYQKAIDFNFNNASVWFYLGNAQQAKGNVTAALQAYSNSIQKNPNFPKAYCKKGNLLKAIGKLDQAIACYERALSLDPNMEEVYIQSASPLQETCSWNGMEIVYKNLDRITSEALAGNQPVNESPFLNITRHADPSLNYQVAVAWNKAMHIPQFKKWNDITWQDRASSKIRIGYLSSDFRDHPVSDFIAELVRHHDRNIFEVYIYSLEKDDGSGSRRRIQQYCHKFVDLDHLEDADSAKRIGYDNLDILVELMGHTRNSRLGICGYRPAPIQVSYLGYPGTTGAEYMDYIITDKTITPEDHSKFYSERVLYLPNSYMAFDPNQPVSKCGFKREHFGLPEDAFIFCSFNKASKLEPIMFDIWMRILKKVHSSRLWLVQLHPLAVENLRKEAQKRGIDPERLIFSERMRSKSEHLERLGLADLALDTRVYNGHVTTGDALIAGVPVLTLKGTHFASRVGASLLYAAGLPEFVASSAEAYEDLAVKLARDKNLLMTYRNKLNENHNTAPLFDTPQFVTHLECIYRNIRKTHQATYQTQPVSISSEKAELSIKTRAGHGMIQRIFISSMPRAGSMWTYNVVRELIRAAKLKPIPESARTQTDALIEEAFRESPALDEIYCVKTHQLISGYNSGHNDDGSTRIIVPYRDVRDSMLSFMRFMRTSFDHALGALKEWMMMTDVYASQQSDHILMIRYDDLVENPLGIIKKIDGFLSFHNKTAIMDRINSELSKERIKQKIDGFKSLGADDLLRESTRLSSVKNMDGSYRVFDRSSGFQSNHITSKKEGEWRQALNSEQKMRLLAATQSWLEKYSFPA